MTVNLSISLKVSNVYAICPSNFFPQNYPTDNFAFEKNDICKKLLSTALFIINRLTNDLTMGLLNNAIQRLLERMIWIDQ